jgi:hypothetical protein
MFNRFARVSVSSSSNDVLYTGSNADASTHSGAAHQGAAANRSFAHCGAAADDSANYSGAAQSNHETDSQRTADSASNKGDTNSGCKRTQVG